MQIALLVFAIIAAVAGAAAVVIALGERPQQRQERADAAAERREAAEDRRQAASDRAQAARDRRNAADEHEAERRRTQLERVGHLVERVFWAAQEDMKYTPPTSDHYRPVANELRQALVGLSKTEFQACHAVPDSPNPMSAQAAASNGRLEIDVALQRHAASS